MTQVTMYYKPTCPFCMRAESLLMERGVTNLEKINVETNSALKAEMIHRANGRTTVPQIFINSQHIGGCDDLFELDYAGKLDELLAS